MIEPWLLMVGAAILVVLVSYYIGWKKRWDNARWPGMWK